MSGLPYDFFNKQHNQLLRFYFFNNIIKNNKFNKISIYVSNYNFDFFEIL